ncbi:CocE/NonD family hydrolase [Rugosimonospora africana]|uniref:CocE/NonD family hydrolase n=1 Tax=Rugosimonospora africana TaxID=556532 RepID=UPI0019430D4F|nr:CocE/NonD family hydrolase [Rugosimonospora africana]
MAAASVLGALAAPVVFAGVPAAARAASPAIVVRDEQTQVAFGYTDAVRQRVWVESDFDSDGDGSDDRIAVDIIRPAATEQGLKVPVIMDASPYYTTLGRGNESQLKVDDANGDGLLAQWPLFLDNYFVPRGYAVALVDMTGTGHSTGCPTVQGETDNMAAVEVIDWLSGRRTAHDKDGVAVTAAGWFSGKTGMIGKSYDASLSAAAAVTGVPGLTTIVDESGPYDYYDYTRSNGVIQRGNHYLASLANTVTNPGNLAPAPGTSQAHCLATRNDLSANDGDATGNSSAFWDERNYVKDAGKVRASVLATQGMEDENVRPDHFSKWWYALSALGVPRKAWLMQVGHVDPFDVNRSAWVDELHRWFDYWLWGVPNGVMDEPQATVETHPGQWQSEASWPAPGSEPTQVFLQTGPDAGQLGLAPATGTEQTTTFTDSATQRETTMLANPTTVTANRRVFLSPVLNAPLRLSGTALVQLAASVDAPETHLGAILVDYGPAFPRVVDNINNNGVTTLSTSDCWGESSPTDSPCYKDVGELIDTTSTAWRVSKGILDGEHRTSLSTQTPLVPGQVYPFSFPLLPQDYTFPAGHRIGVVVVGSYRDYGSTASTTAADITLSLKASRIVLPVVGGRQAATAAGLSGSADTTTSVSQDAAATGYGDSATFTATVAPRDAAMAPAGLPGYVAGALPADEAAGFTGLGTPTGTVQFEDNGTPIGAPVPLHDGTARYTASDLLPGAHSITAVYSAGGPFGGSGSAALNHDVTIGFEKVEAIVAADSSDPAVTRALNGLLSAAAGAPNRHIRDNLLNAFERQVSAESGGALTAAEAALLTTLAEALK